MALKQVLLVLATTSLAACQRPSFAGSRPIGYPDVISTNTASALGDRFGDDDNNTSTTTQRLPIEAKGDKNLVDRLSKLPIDKQPFWFINWQAYEANRQKPQTYPIRPNFFAQPISPGSGNAFNNNNNFNTGGNPGNVDNLGNRNGPNVPNAINNSQGFSNSANNNASFGVNTINARNTSDFNIGNRNGEFGNKNTAKPNLSVLSIDASQQQDSNLENKYGEPESSPPVQNFQTLANYNAGNSNRGSHVTANRFRHSHGSGNSGFSNAAY